MEDGAWGGVSTRVLKRLADIIVHWQANQRTSFASG